MNLTTITYDADKYKLVPREPSREMVLSGCKEAKYQTERGLTMDCTIHIYREMLTAAPQPETLSPWLPMKDVPKEGDFLLKVWSGDWHNPRAHGFVIYHATGNRSGEPSWVMKGCYRTEEGGAYELGGWMPIPKQEQ